MNDGLPKPCSPSCERNRQPILDVLNRAFADRSRVLEIGSGSGQHAVHFARALPHLIWQTSDRAQNLAGICQWLDEAQLPNTPAPIVLDVGQSDWSSTRYDAVFSANTLHIMAWAEVETLFARLPDVLSADARLVIYGPFNIDGRHTSASNAEFDIWLHQQAPHMGIRDLADVDALAASAGLERVADHPMPANNRCLVWHTKKGTEELSV